MLSFRADVVYCASVRIIVIKIQSKQNLSMKKKKKIRLFKPYALLSSKFNQSRIAPWKKDSLGLTWTEGVTHNLIFIFFFFFVFPLAKSLNDIKYLHSENKEGPNKTTRMHRLRCPLGDQSTNYCRCTIRFCQLTVTSFRADSADDKLIIFLSFFPEDRIWQFMQIVSIADSLHELSKPIF